MAQKSSIAANLKPEQRKQLFIEMQSSAQTVTALANQEGVSRKFLYQQQQKGNQALEREFNQPQEDSEVLYWIPVTKKWIFQVILALILICHSSYRGVVEFLRDVFDYQVSVATVDFVPATQLTIEWGRWWPKPKKSIKPKTYQELRWD